MPADTMMIAIVLRLLRRDIAGEVYMESTMALTVVRKTSPQAIEQGRTHLVLAAICFLACFVLLVAGLTLCTYGYLAARPMHGLDAVMLVVSFGSAVVGAHCLDRIGEKKRARWK